MKKAMMIAVMVLGVSSSSQAALFSGLVIPFVIGAQTVNADKTADSRLNQTVTASWKGETGYVFDITRFEYENNKSKYDLK